MNFVFVGSSPRAWGSEQHFIELARACHEAGHRVIAVVREDSEVASLLKDYGIDVRATPFRGGEDPRAMIAAFKAIREIRADWVVTAHKKHYWPLYILTRFTRTKLAAFRHLIAINDWATRVIYPRLVERFFVVSDFALDALASAGAPRHKLSRLYNQIDLNRFFPSQARREETRTALKIPHDAFVVGFVGRHESSKGVRILREALEHAMDEHPNLYAVWIGGGPEWMETQTAVKFSYAPWRHRFVEWTRTPELMYPAFDCLIAPSTAPETFGRVVVEAQACGIPVIASQAGGLIEAFAVGQTGEIFHGYDPRTLSQQITRLANDKPRRIEMGEAGRQFARRFDSPVVLRAFIENLTSGSTSTQAGAPIVISEPNRSPIS